MKFLPGYVKASTRSPLYIIVCVIVFFSLFSIISCVDDKDDDGVPDGRDKCPDIFAKTKDGCPLPEKQIGKIHFYIDNSASMAGYFAKDAEFNEIISDLAAKIDKEIKPIDIAFIADSIAPYNNSVQQFSTDIARTQPANQRSSQLHLMIKKMADRNDSNDVSLLVSDCILSFPDDAIKANREINKEKAPSALKNNIYSSFADLNKNSTAASVYAFTSKFYGTFYDYHNTKKKLTGEERPFYVWVIANKELLPKFNKKLGDINSFQPKQSLDFGMTEEPVTQFDVLSQIEKKGNWVWDKGSKTIEDFNTKESDQQFCVALNLDKLPAYARTPEYLKSNLLLHNTGCEVVIAAVKDKASVDRSKLKSNSQQKTYEEASHFILFGVQSLSLPEATMEVTLPLKYDSWYESWSTMDDTNDAGLNKQTFALQYLIAGVKDAYDTKNNQFIQFMLHLKK